MVIHGVVDTASGYRHVYSLSRKAFLCIYELDPEGGGLETKRDMAATTKSCSIMQKEDTDRVI